MKPDSVRHFRSAAQCRRWLQKNHASAAAQWVAIAKKDAENHLLRYPDALDVALAFGWIDGFVGKLDATHYALRFSPRKPRSNWSAVNLKRFAQLRVRGLIEEPGRTAFEQRDRSVSEDERAELNGAALQALQANQAAWTFFSAQPPRLPAAGELGGAERLRVFRSCPLITPEDARSSLRMLAIARAMAALCA